MVRARFMKNDMDKARRNALMNCERCHYYNSGSGHCYVGSNKACPQNITISSGNAPAKKVFEEVIRKDDNSVVLSETVFVEVMDGSILMDPHDADDGVARAELVMVPSFKTNFHLFGAYTPSLNISVVRATVKDVDGTEKRTYLYFDMGKEVFSFEKPNDGFRERTLKNSINAISLFYNQLAWEVVTND